MIIQHIIYPHHIQDMVSAIKSGYQGGFSNPDFKKDYSVPCSTHDSYVEFLMGLKNKEDIVKHIVEYVVGYGIFKVEDLKEEDQVLYVNKDLEVDVTEEYLDAHYRYFEDGF